MTGLNKQQAIEWYHLIQGGDGTGFVRRLYRNQFPIGGIAEKYWDDPTFTYGMEYGILIAIARIFDLSPEDVGEEEV